MNFKELFLEKVSPDCSSGAGLVPGSPWFGWNLIRTNHLDDIREPGNKQRDHGFECVDFQDLVKHINQKRPMGLNDGEYQMVWKNPKGYQAMMVNVNNSKKEMVIKTIIQLNKKKPLDYHPRKGDKFLDLGSMKVPL